MSTNDARRRGPAPAQDPVTGAVDVARVRAGGLDLIDTDAALERAVALLRAGRGPIAIDAERASGYRYSERAYLVQLYRRDSGTFLVDPLPFETLAPLAEAVPDVEWIIHAATQDLSCLREVGIDPEFLFDTELAARLLGLPRVGLGAVVEQLLGIKLAKAHSADDWSMRPLPVEWLAYAALDVELLVDVRDSLAELLAESGKSEIAEQEFQAVLARDLSHRREEPWRRLIGHAKLRGSRSLAVARELWTARDEYARATDTAPGRIVPDRSLSAVANELPRSRGQLAAMRSFTGRESRSQIDRWWAAIERGLETTDLPGRPLQPADHMPPHRSWEQRHPEAHARLQAARPRIQEKAEEYGMPVENLLTPDHLRRVAWQPPAPADAESIGAQLAGLGARPWQIEATAQVIAAAFADAGAGLVVSVDDVPAA